MRDLSIIVLSIVIAVILAKTGVLAELFTSAQGWKILGSLIAGIFFVSIFTAVPAGVVLFEIAATNSIWEVALFGGIGALIGDLIIFRFIKDSLSEDIRLFMGKSGWRRLTAVLNVRLVRWMVPLIGALIVASPLPDEIGLTMMGLSKMKTSVFIPLSFLLNFFGILIIGAFAKAAL